MAFDPAFPVARLRGAEYNPRLIAADALEQLQRSIERVGFAKPVITTEDGLIVAGHQRTKASRLLGRTHVPAFVLKTVSERDEVRFNQLHNGTDLDEIDDPVYVPPSQALGFTEVAGPLVRGNLRSRGAVVRKEICGLLTRYGNWGGAVATQSGLVVSSPQYALSCNLLDWPCRVYRIPDELGEEARAWFARSYGEFSYEHLAKNPYLQTYAQMFRLRGEGSLHSTLYEQVVLPILRPHERLLDFGCGQADYLRLLQRRGQPAQGVEFFHRTGKMIDGGKVHALIDAALADVRRFGLFDVVVCDSVLNGVDSLQAEHDVLVCCSAFLRPGGRVHFSGRRREQVEGDLNMTVEASKVRRVEFLDRHGFSGLFREGAWFYQKFHSAEQVKALARKYFAQSFAHQEGQSTSWQVTATKAFSFSPEVEEASVRREFDLPWPGGRTVGRGDAAVAALRAVRTVKT